MWWVGAIDYKEYKTVCKWIDSKMNPTDTSTVRQVSVRALRGYRWVEAAEDIDGDELWLTDRFFQRADYMECRDAMLRAGIPVGVMVATPEPGSYTEPAPAPAPFQAPVPSYAQPSYHGPSYSPDASYDYAGFLLSLSRLQTLRPRESLSISSYDLERISYTQMRMIGEALRGTDIEFYREPMSDVTIFRRRPWRI